MGQRKTKFNKFMADWAQDNEEFIVKPKEGQPFYCSEVICNNMRMQYVECYGYAKNGTLSLIMCLTMNEIAKIQMYNPLFGITHQDINFF